MKRENENSNFLWMIRLSRGCRGRLLSLFFTRTVFAFINIMMAAILSEFTEYAIGNTKYSLATLVTITLVLFVLEGSMYVIEAISKKSAYSYLERKIRINAIKKIQVSEMLEVEKYHTDEVFSRLTKDTEVVANCLQNLIVNIWGGILMAVIAFCYMLFLSWKLSLAIIVAIPLLGIVVSIFAPRLQKAAEADKLNEDRNRIHMREVLDFTIVSQVFSVMDYMTGRVGESYEAKRRSTFRLGILEGVFSFLNNLTGSAMFLIIMGLGAFLTVKGEFSVGGMIAVLNLLNYIVWPFSNISSSVNDFNTALVSAKRIRALEEFSVKAAVIPAMEKQNHPIKVGVRGVSFSYNGAAELLKELNLEFSSGSIVGIVGKNGCGKSTFLKLLAGIYRPIKGEIEYYACDKGTACNMAYVPSGSYIFSGTVLENICMTKKPDMVRLDCAVEMANAKEFIEQLDNQYNEKIGKGYMALSSGQAQRIALARAYYKAADIYFFDEPTANLDKISAAVFYDTLKKLGKESLCFIVSHDANVAEYCDCVVEMNAL
ncbi:MAG: ABC transporter ATP-binding protein/permease [Muribaculaceae bacterium]|nr:ABC transporter ATP-binding protein/permease [Roseburia sp.]MCM1431375.1 ABC transporter ATP-binding protein/permease [Muribaculaceae bacterium]MCM1491817.1 ABC transporter ATP-binding protein/permease [Muribaculaceae bacterium]